MIRALIDTSKFEKDNVNKKHSQALLKNVLLRTIFENTSKGIIKILFENYAQ